MISNMLQRDVQTLRLELRPLQTMFVNEPRSEPLCASGSFGVGKQAIKQSLRPLGPDRQIPIKLKYALQEGRSDAAPPRLEQNMN